MTSIINRFPRLEGVAGGVQLKVKEHLENEDRETRTFVLPQPHSYF